MSAQPSAPARVALVLGSGGARGYAHIGVIDAIRERGWQIAGIAGSSMGALVGGLHAAGRLDDFTQWATSLTQLAVLRLLDPSIAGAGVLRAEKVLDAVRDILGPIHIEDLPIPYTAVATDLLAGKSVWFQRGPLDEAIRASIAIPGVIAPYELGGRLLADGGILDPVPMAPLAAVNADLTIAVRLSSSAAGGGRDPDPGAASEWLNRMLRGTSSLFDTAGSLFDRSTPRAMLSRFSAMLPDSVDFFDMPEAKPPAEASTDGPAAPRLGGFEVMNRTIEIAQSALARHTLAAYPPDLLIEVPRSTCRALEFHRAAEVIAVGRELADRALDELGEPAPPAAD